MIYTLVLILVFMFLTFMGFAIHWSFHQKWSGIFYRKHYNHHFLQYPADDLLSDTYRHSGKDNSVVLFGICFSPIVLTAVLLTIFGVIPMFLGVMILIEMGIIGFLNDNLHDAFHLNKSFWMRFKYFERLRQLHFLHHYNTQSNFGIFSFVWDRFFRTYNKG